MAKKPVKRDYVDLTLPELTEAERLEYIERLEYERENVIFELEQRMTRLAKMLKKRSLSRRKHKLGASPNDYKA